MRCSNCEAAVAAADRFCPECGVEFLEGEETDESPGTGSIANLLGSMQDIEVSRATLGITGAVLVVLFGLLHFDVASPGTIGLTVLIGIGIILAVRNDLHRHPSLIGYSYGVLAVVFLITPIFLAPTDVNPYTTGFGALQAGAGIIYLGAGALLLSRHDLEGVIGLRPAAVTFLGLILYVVGFLTMFLL